MAYSGLLLQLAAMQMFLEYQNISGTGLRRMMDAPIVSTARCVVLSGHPASTSKQAGQVCCYPTSCASWYGASSS